MFSLCELGISRFLSGFLEKSRERPGDSPGKSREKIDISHYFNKICFLLVGGEKGEIFYVFLKKNDWFEKFFYRIGMSYSIWRAKRVTPSWIEKTILPSSK